MNSFPSPGNVEKRIWPSIWLQHRQLSQYPQAVGFWLDVLTTLHLKKCERNGKTHNFGGYKNGMMVILGLIKNEEFEFCGL